MATCRFAIVLLVAVCMFGGFVEAGENAASAVPVIPRQGMDKAEAEIRDFTVPIELIKPAIAPLLKSPYYTIQDNIKTVGPFCIFVVECEHGTYEVISIHNLYKVCHEISVIESYRNTPHGNEIFEGMTANVTKTISGAKNLIFHPGQSAQAIARAPARKLRSLGGLFHSEEKAGDGTSRTAGAKGFMLSSGMRVVAYELGLDVYSDNANVQAFIKEIAKQRKAGQLTVDIAKFAAGPALSTGASVAVSAAKNSLTAGGLDVATEALIAQNGSSELNRILLKKYETEIGLNDADLAKAEQLLQNKNYSPREQAYLNLHLRRMQYVAGMDKALAYLVAVDTPTEAILAVSQLELLAELSQRFQPAKRFLALPAILGYADRDNSAVVALPYDVLYGDLEKEELVGEIVDSAQQQGCQKFNLWVTGYATRSTIEKAKAGGVNLRTGLLPFMNP